MAAPLQPGVFCVFFFFFFKSDARGWLPSPLQCLMTTLVDSDVRPDMTLALKNELTPIGSGAFLFLQLERLGVVRLGDLVEWFVRGPLACLLSSALLTSSLAWIDTPSRPTCPFSELQAQTVMHVLRQRFGKSLLLLSRHTSRLRLRVGTSSGAHLVALFEALEAVCRPLAISRYIVSQTTTDSVLELILQEDISATATTQLRCVRLRARCRRRRCD